MKRIIIYILLLFTLISTVNAQIIPLAKDSVYIENDSLPKFKKFQTMSSENYDIQIPQIVSQTPNAAALQQYIDHPVSHFSGIPNIDIPIYEIDIDGFKLPISISYHASGIKAAQEASWIGLGWALNTGGIVTRSIMSGDDLDPEAPLFHLEDEYSLDKIISGNPYKIYNNDYEPDIYNFTLGRSSGKFIFGENNVPILLKTDQDVRIKIKHGLLSNKQGRYHYQFEITEENGIVYIFEDSELTYSVSSTLGSQYDGYIIDSDKYKYKSDSWYQSIGINTETAWLLSEIILPNGENIRFNYIQEINPSQTPTSLTEYSVQSFTPPYQTIKPTKRLQVSASRTAREQLIKEIIWSQGRIEFEHSVRNDIKPQNFACPSKKLEKIRIYNNIQSEPLFSYRFEYGYFNESYLNSTNDNQFLYTRLKLNALHKESKNIPVESHKFFYNESKELPHKNTNQHDHWGYFNSNMVTDKLIPRPDDFMDIISKEHLPTDGVDRTSCEEHIYLGILNKIIYPTGGESELLYEQNNFYVETMRDESYYERIQVETSENHEQYFEISQSNQEIKIEGFLENTTMTCDIYEKLSDFYKPYYPWVSIYKLNIGTQKYDLIYSIPIGEYECDDVPNNIMLINKVTTMNLSKGKYKLQVTPPNNFDAYFTMFIKYFKQNGIQKKISGAGVRIAQIKTDAKIRKFTYGSLPMDAYLLTHCRYAVERDFGGIEIQSHSWLPLADFNTGVSVGYTKVQETISSEDNKSTIEYKFEIDPEEDLKTNLISFAGTFPDDENSNDPDVIKLTLSAFAKYGALDKLCKTPRTPVYSNGLPAEINYYKNDKIIKQERFHYTKYEMDTLIFSYKTMTRPVFWRENDIMIIYSGGGEKLVPAHDVTKIDMYPYERKIERWKLTKKETSQFESDKEFIIITEDYTYNGFNSFKPSELLVNRSDGKSIKNIYKYPIDFATIEPYKSMVTKNIVSPVIERSQYLNNNFLQKKKINYKKTDNSIFVPSTEQIQRNTSDIETRLIYHNYDKYGNPLYISMDDATKVVYLWSYGGQYPIAEIKNATYDQVKAHIDIDALSQKTEPTENDIRSIQNLQTTLKDAMVTTYTYKPLVGMTAMTDPSGVTTYYEYDDFGRLKESYYYENNDVNKRRVLQIYEYNYQNK